MTPYETAKARVDQAKARVEAGDVSFEAIAALTLAHGEKLVADSQRLDPTASPSNESAEAYVLGPPPPVRCDQSCRRASGCHPQRDGDMPCESVARPRPLHAGRRQACGFAMQLMDHGRSGSAASTESAG